MRKPVNRHYNNFLSNSRINVTRFNYSGIITNNQNYLQGLEYNSWEPPSDWLELPRLQDGDQKFVGLLAIIKGASGATAANADSNFIALLCQGNYIVDWGNGVTSAHTSNTQARYQYNFADIPDSTLTTEGYKQVIVQAYPQAGQTLTTINLNQRYTVAGVTLASGYVNTWLDIKIAGKNISTLTIRTASPVVEMNMLKRFEYVGTSAITNIGNNFLSNCYALEKIIGQRFTENNTNFFRFAAGCNSLSYLDLIDTRKATNFQFPFTSCYSLQTFPPIHTGALAGGNGTYFFDGCATLKNVPYLDTSKLTNFDRFFSGCYALKRIPDIDTSSATTLSQMFYECRSLEEIPLLNTSNCTNMNAMFFRTYSLKKIPLLDTKNVTDFREMFNASGIYELPEINVEKGTLFGRMFFTSPCITRVKGLTFSSATNMTELFYQNGNLLEVGPFDFTGVTSGSTAAGATGPFNGFFFGLGGLSKIDFKGLQKSINISNQTLSPANLNYLFDNLANVTGTGATITITNNWGTAQCDRTIATGKGWTVVG
jgi:hypothetical protein